jgi:hypothetical protein
MEQSPALEANRSSASQEIQRILWNLDVHCLIHNSPLLIPVVSQMNPYHAHIPLLEDPL